MRISDWSSDVCSSDLLLQRNLVTGVGSVGAHLATGLAAQIRAQFAQLGGPARQQRDIVALACKRFGQRGADTGPGANDETHWPAFRLLATWRGTACGPGNPSCRHGLAPMIDRKSGGWGKGVSVRVESGGRRTIKKK